MARVRLEFDADRSAKFWEVEVKGRTQVVCYGRLGTPGRIVEKQFATKEDAKASADKLIRAKVKKGYREVTRDAPKAKRSTKRPRPTTSAAARHSRATKLLGEAIYREAEKKGANINGSRDLPKSVKRCTPVVAEFYQNIVWPRGKEFEAKIDDFELKAISFDGPVQAFDPESFGVVGCEGMDLFAVGMHGGGNKILLLDGNDKRKSDPTVYEVDHHPEPDDTLWNFGRLSKFLRRMNRPS